MITCQLIDHELKHLPQQSRHFLTFFHRLFAKIISIYIHHSATCYILGIYQIRNIITSGFITY